MPYDLPFERVAEVDNGTALELNKSIAAKLITDFPEIYDLNSADSSTHFTRQEVNNLENEFPEKHFSLYAEVEGMNFSFQFWKNTLWLELGAGGNAYHRFALVRKYATFILQQEFRIITSDNEVVALKEGIDWHWREYKEWVGFVEHVAKLAATEPPPKTE